MFSHSIETRETLPVTPEVAWATLSKWDSWPSWCSFLTILEPPTQVGKPFKIRISPKGATPQEFKPQLTALDPAKELRWRGRLWGSELFFVGEHSFRFVPGPDAGTTTLVHGERFRGCLVPLLGKMLRDTEVEFCGLNQQLKDRLAAGSS